MTLKSRQTGQNTREELLEKDFKKELKDKEEKLKPTVVKEILDQKYDDADDVLADSDKSDNDSDDDDDDDDDDDEELYKELAKLKKERQMEQERKEQEEQAVQQRQQREQALVSNPLLQPEFSDTTSDNSFSLKRKWNDDVIFKNQARDEPKTKKRFINDTIRNDFHRKFLDKYMK
jgi:protein CWC15